MHNKKNDKFKYELGKKADKDFKFPEVLYESHPGIVSDPWGEISGIVLLQSKLLSPFREIKRRLKK